MCDKNDQQQLSISCLKPAHPPPVEFSGFSPISAQIYPPLWNATTEKLTPNHIAHTKIKYFSKYVPTGTSEPIITCLKAVLQIELQVIFVYLWVSHRSLDSRVLLHGLHPALELWGVTQTATGKGKRLNNVNGKLGGHEGSKTTWTLPFYCLFCFLLPSINIQLVTETCIRS